MPPVSQPPSGARGQVCVDNSAIFTEQVPRANATGAASRALAISRAAAWPRLAWSVRGAKIMRRPLAAPCSASSLLCLAPSFRPGVWRQASRRSGGFLLRLSALGAAQLFTGQFLVKGLATIDANLAAFIFSAHR